MLVGTRLSTGCTAEPRSTFLCMYDSALKPGAACLHHACSWAQPHSITGQPHALSPSATDDSQVIIPHSSACRYRLPSQQHFYMEPQAAVAVPGEDGCLTVHSATQSLDAVQASVAQALGMPANKVNIGVPLVHSMDCGLYAL